MHLITYFNESLSVILTLPAATVQCSAVYALHCTALNFPRSTELKYNAQPYNEVHCTALHCTALHCTALHCTALQPTALHFTALNRTALHCTALNCTALHCTALHWTALHCTALHCTVKLIHILLNEEQKIEEQTNLVTLKFQRYQQKNPKIT